MALKYERGESTGIYVEGRWRGTGKVGMYKVALMITRSMDVDLQLADIERKARRVLRSHRVKFGRKSGLPIGLPMSAPGILRDAANVLYQVYFVRDWIAKNHAGNAALHGLMLGRSLERLTIRPFEKWVLRGKKDYADRQRGATKRFGTQEQKEKLRDTYRREYQFMRASNPRLTRNCVAGRVAAKLTTAGQKVSIQTILRHTKKPHQS